MADLRVLLLLRTHQVRGQKLALVSFCWFVDFDLHRFSIDSSLLRTNTIIDRVRYYWFMGLVEGQQGQDSVRTKENHSVTAEKFDDGVNGQKTLEFINKVEFSAENLRRRRHGLQAGLLPTPS
jgi:hypothetical protein